MQIKIVAALALSLFCFGGSSAEPQDEVVIRIVMKANWEKPDSTLTVDPIVVAGGYAIADWEQGEMGGRALLKKKHENWEVQLCAGDEIKSAETLKSLGVSADIASRIATELSNAEKSLSDARLRKISSFKGLVRMDEVPHSNK